MYEQLTIAGFREDEAKKVVNYFESNRDNKAIWTLNDNDSRLDLALKYHSVGLLLDGINVVITGKGRAFITYIGYKNKVLSIYPEAEFDVQLVSEGDEFSFEKNSGEVKYHHKFNDPFGAKPIIGAYAFVKTNSGQVLEFLDRPTFEKMKKTAMMTKTWNDWESEFFLKSVIKRVCKRKFNDIVKDIEELDNNDYEVNNQTRGKVTVTRTSSESDAAKEAIRLLEEAKTRDELKKIWSETPRIVQVVESVQKAKDNMKAKLA